MQQSDRPAFLEVVLGFAELKGKQLSAPALELYWRSMRHWDLQEFRQAADHLIRSCEFMPTPKDFEDLKKAGEPTAGEAWDMVLHRKALPGSRAERAAQIASNGRRIGMLDMERELPHVQRRFFDVYNELSDVESVRDSVPQIAAPRVTNGLQRLGSIRPSLPHVRLELLEDDR
jgi:hypothetical protein